MLKKPAVISIFCLIVVLTGLFHAKILIGLAGFLIVDDPLVPADALVMLNGEVETRPFHATGTLGCRQARGDDPVGCLVEGRTFGYRVGCAVDHTEPLDSHTRGSGRGGKCCGCAEGYGQTSRKGNVGNRSVSAQGHGDSISVKVRPGGCGCGCKTR